MLGVFHKVAFSSATTHEGHRKTNSLQKIRSFTGFQAEFKFRLGRACNAPKGFMLRTEF